MNSDRSGVTSVIPAAEPGPIGLNIIERGPVQGAAHAGSAPANP